MHEWLKLSDRRKIEILNTVSAKTGLSENAIEKDWWVTLALKAAFETQWKDDLIFKGGTSLSKSWNLIERFSEDIDLAINREAIGFSGNLSNNRIKNLRKASFKFVSNDFKNAIQQQLERYIDIKSFILSAQQSVDSDKDPHILELQYNSILSRNKYVADRVLLEVGARSLREPTNAREIQSIIDVTFPEQLFSDKPFLVETVEPKRTFLEKIFLLHEEFLKPNESIRHQRMSRHLYDLERLMDTEHGHAALADKNLYKTIVEHRKKFNQLRGIDYTKHAVEYINFIPPDSVLPTWQEDYRLMLSSLIYGNAPDFNQLILRLRELLQRVRES